MLGPGGVAMGRKAKKPKGGAKMVIMTADEVRAARLCGAKRDLMGSDVRNHNGARSVVSRNKKADEKRRRWSAEDKRREWGDA